MAALLFTAYWTLWRPARTWLMPHVAAPVLAAVDTPHARRYAVSGTAAPRSVLVWARRAAVEAGTAPPASYRMEAPAGVPFLLPALLLIGCCPWRGYWAWFGLGHVGVSALALACLALGLAVGEPGFSLFRLANRYLVDAYSLAVPLLLLVAGGRLRLDALRPDPSPDTAATPPDAS
jgi:hypothetical protein